MAGKRRTLIATAVLTLLAAAGCDKESGGAAEGTPPRVNPGVDWLKENLIRGTVEPRLVHGLRADGFYQPNLGPDWTPVPPQVATLVSQSRAIYVMAMGYEVAGDTRYLDATKRAADYLLMRFSNPRVPGHWVRAVSLDGKVASSEFHAYGHTQVILALAHAFKVAKDDRYLDAAMHTWLALDVPGAIAGKNSLYDLRGLNVAMHLFEALLVLYKATASKLVREDLRSLGDYIVARFFDPQRGYFVESLTPQLARSPDGDVTPGHSIEMAFLLSRAVDAGLPESWLKPADASAGFVARLTAGEGRGIVPLTIDYEGNVRDGQRPWWAQAELLRGLGHFMAHRGRDDLRAQYEVTLKTVRALYVDPVSGAWYGRPGAKGENRSDEWKVGYHVTMMATELMRLNGMRFRSGSEVLL